MRVGLDYPALESTMRMMGLAEADKPEIFEKVRVMEAEALQIWTAER